MAILLSWRGEVLLIASRSYRSLRQALLDKHGTGRAGLSRMTYTIMDLSIIIVSWNVKEKLRENLRAIYESSPLPPPLGFPLGQGEKKLEFEVFVIDNNSADGSADMVKNEFSQAQLIRNDANLGFAKANNQGIKMAKGKYILLLNPDMKVFPDTLRNMVGWMDANQQATVAGCHLVSETGEIVKHVRRFPTVWDQLAIVLKLPHLFPGVLDKYLRNDFDYTKPGKVDSVRGGFFMFKNVSGLVKGMIERSANTDKQAKGKFTLPFMDERYFIWFEEVDYCRQVKAMGGEVWYTPAAKCIDYVGQSFKQVKRGTTQNYFRESMLKYFRKWHPWWQFILLWKAWFFGLFIAWITEKLKIQSKTKT